MLLTQHTPMRNLAIYTPRPNPRQLLLRFSSAYFPLGVPPSREGIICALAPATLPPYKHWTTT